MNLVRPETAKSDSYIVLKNALLRYASEPNDPSKRALSGIETVDLVRTVDASRLSCGSKKVDEVDIEDQLNFVDSPPERYLARAEEFPHQKVQITDLLSDSRPPAETNNSGGVTYYKERIAVRDGQSRVRYSWTNAHGGDQLEVWSRPAARLRNFEVYLKLPPDVSVTPKEIKPPGLSCDWSDKDCHVFCRNVLTFYEEMVITWDWNMWTRCKSGESNPKRKKAH
jgi:hypothetical protein